MPGAKTGTTMRLKRRCIVIFNSRSGSADQGLERALEVLRAGQLDVVPFSPDDPAEIDEILRREAPKADSVVLGGGDGTFSSSAKALLEVGKPLGILPLGTANDFARSLGIPQDLEQAAAIIVEGHRRDVDVGLVDERPFLNVATIGFSAEVARHHEGERKRRLGVLNYPLSWFDAYRSHRPFRATLVLDGITRRCRCSQLAVGSGRHYGAGLTIAEDARIDDGLLRVYYVEPMSALGWLWLLPALRFGRLKKQPEAALFTAKSVQVSTSRPKSINIDGELAGRTPAEFHIAPQVLSVFAPRPSNGASAPSQEAKAPMSILRSDDQIALNDLIIACREAANGHRTAAELLSEDALAQRLEEIARDRDAMAERLAEIVIKADDVPDAPSAEKELLGSAAMRLKAVISEDEIRAVLDDCRLKERKVVESADALLAADPEDAVRHSVEELKSDAASRLDRLASDYRASQT